MSKSLKSKVGNYTLDKFLGEGGVGKVFRGQKEGPQGFSKQVAIKILHPEVIQKQGIQSSLISEARVVSQLNHPHIVQVYDLGEADQTLFVVMELIDGFSLEQLWEKCRGEIPLEVSVAVILEVAMALDFIHNASLENKDLTIIHGDISLQNIMVQKGLYISKLNDFGFARVTERGKPVRVRTPIVGNPFYISPEHVRGEWLDIRSDIYSLGVVFYDLLLGNRDFTLDIKTITSLARRAESVDRKQISLLPASLGRILTQMLEPDPVHRYASARNLLSDLDDFVTQGLSLSSLRRKKQEFFDPFFGTSVNPNARTESQIPSATNTESSGLSKAQASTSLPNAKDSAAAAPSSLSSLPKATSAEITTSTQKNELGAFVVKSRVKPTPEPLPSNANTDNQKVTSLSQTSAHPAKPSKSAPVRAGRSMLIPMHSHDLSTEGVEIKPKSSVSQNTSRAQLPSGSLMSQRTQLLDSQDGAESLPRSPGDSSPKRGAPKGFWMGTAACVLLGLGAWIWQASKKDPPQGSQVGSSPSPRTNPVVGQKGQGQDSAHSSASMTQNMGNLKVHTNVWSEVRILDSQKNPVQRGLTTPVDTQLPPGSYTVYLSHPRFGEIKYQVQIQSGEVKNVKHEFK
jgi:serine/threonine protein kinase